MRAQPVALTSALTIACRHLSAPAEVELDDHRIAIAVGDDARQPVGLGMDQAQPLLPAQFGQRLAARDGGGDAAFEKGIIDRFVARECPEAGADLRMRAVGRPPERAQVVRQHLDRVARPRAPFQAADRTGEQPGVALDGRALLARQEDQLGHVDCGGRNTKPRLPCGNRGFVERRTLNPAPCGCGRGIRRRR